MKNFFKTLSFNTFIPFFYPALMLPIRSWRKKAIGLLSFKPGDRVLIPGIGTGHDVPFIPDNVSVEGIDISDVMLGLGRIKQNIFKYSSSLEFKKMDAENLEYPDNTFDRAILSLFLTVVFDPKKAFSEIVRVVKPGGEILVYDHLLREGDMPVTIAKPIDSILSYGFSSVTREFEDIIEKQPVTLKEEIPGDPLNFVKAFLLVKKNK